MPYAAVSTVCRTVWRLGSFSAMAMPAMPMRGRSSKTSHARRGCSPRIVAVPVAGEEVAGGDVQQGGLAGAVGAEDDPALALLDRPGDLVHQSPALADHGYVHQLQNIAHERVVSPCSVGLDVSRRPCACGRSPQGKPTPPVGWSVPSVRSLGWGHAFGTTLRTAGRLGKCPVGRTCLAGRRRARDRRRGRGAPGGGAAR